MNAYLQGKLLESSGTSMLQHGPGLIDCIQMEPSITTRKTMYMYHPKESLTYDKLLR